MSPPATGGLPVSQEVLVTNSALTFHQVYVMKAKSCETGVTLTALCRELYLSKGQ